MSDARARRLANVQPPPVPAAEGNERSVTHGAFSPRKVGPEAEALARVVVEHAPHLVESDSAAVFDYAIAQVRAWRLAEWIESKGELDGKGHPRPALRELREWLSRAERARSRLGLDPLSRASLNLDRARTFDLIAAHEEMAEGARLVEAAKQRVELEPGHDTP